MDLGFKEIRKAGMGTGGGRPCYFTKAGAVLKGGGDRPLKTGSAVTFKWFIGKTGGWGEAQVVGANELPWTQGGGGCQKP